MFGSLDIGIWNLFVIWCLGFGISINLGVDFENEDELNLQSEILLLLFSLLQFS